VLGAVGLPEPARGAARIPRLLAARARVRAALAWPAAQRADDGGTAARQADVCWAVSTGLGFVDPVVASEYSSRFTRAALRAGDPARVVRALSAEAMVRVGGGERAWPEVATLLRQAEDLARRHGDPLTLGRAIGAHGVAAGLCQRFEQARQSCELAEPILRDRAGKAPWEVATVQHFALYAALELGELDFVCRRAPELYRDYRARDNRYAASGVATHYANLAWLVTEGPARARAIVHEAESFFPQDRFHLPRYDACIAHVHLDLHEGRPERALARVGELFRLLRASQLLRVQALRVDALYLRARTELAMAAVARLGRPWLLARAWRSVGALAGTSSLLARPLATLLSAAAFALAGRRSAAEASLRRAVSGLDGARALLLAACARLKLGALVGGSEGAELRRAGLAELSPGVLRAPDAFASLFAPGLDP
ncbi:MAG: hypothetical protein HY908_17715, partial [Myxococcales bacterium]|nr:hypothetical protein [Myxococcales bacterium]